VPKNVHLGESICTSITFICGPKFTRFLLSNLGGVVVDQLLFRFLMCLHVLEIFAIKVGSCQKSLRNLDVFLTLSNFTGRAFQKLYARYHPCLATRRLEKSHEDINTNAEVILLHTLNFKANFKFSRLEFFGGPVPLQVCAIKAWSISRACKNLRAQHPLRAEILCPEKCPLGCVNMHLYNFFVCGPKFTGFFCPTWDGLRLSNYFADF